jgi:hypothetical protein
MYQICYTITWFSVNIILLFNFEYIEWIVTCGRLFLKRVVRTKFDIYALLRNMQVHGLLLNFYLCMLLPAIKVWQIVPETV